MGGGEGLEVIRMEQPAGAARPGSRQPEEPAPSPGGAGGVPCPAPRGCERHPRPLRRHRGRGAALAAHRTCRSRQPGEINACVVLRWHHGVFWPGVAFVPPVPAVSLLHGASLAVVACRVRAASPGCGEGEGGREGGREGERRLWRRSGAGAQPEPGMPSRSWGWGLGRSPGPGWAGGMAPQGPSEPGVQRCGSQPREPQL